MPFECDRSRKTARPGDPNERRERDQYGSHEHHEKRRTAQRTIEREPGFGFGVAGRANRTERRCEISDEHREHGRHERHHREHRDVGPEALARASRPSPRSWAWSSPRSMNSRPSDCAASNSPTSAAERGEDPKTVHQRIIGPVHAFQAVDGRRDRHEDVGMRTIHLARPGRAAPAGRRAPWRNRTHSLI